MFGLILFIVLTVNAFMILLWIKASRYRNAKDLCETCKNRKYLSSKEYSKSPCYLCSKQNSMYKIDYNYLKGDNQ